MATLEISQYTVNPDFQLSDDDVLEVRGFYTRSFIASDGVTPVSGNSSNGVEGPYYSITPTLNASGYLVVPAHDVQPTTESNPTAGYIEQLWVNGAYVQTLLPNNNVGTGWAIPTVYGDPIAFDEIAYYNRAKQLLAPESWYDLMIREIERILGDQSYAAVGVNGITSMSFPPDVASVPIAVGDNDPRVAEFNAGMYTASVETVPAPTTAPGVSTPTITLGTFGVQPSNGAFTAGHNYEVAITYNGRTGESTIGPAASFIAAVGQGLAVAPNAPGTTLAASANIYIKDLDGDNTWRRASDPSGAVENNNVGFGDNNSAIGGMAVKYNAAGATPPGVSTATKPDGSTALGETPTVAPTLTKLTALLSSDGALFYAYSWVTENGETALSPFSASVTAPSGTVGAWMPLYITKTPPPGAVAIRVYAGTSATEAAMKLQVEADIGQARVPIHSFNSSGAAHTTTTPTSTISTAQKAYDDAMDAGAGLVVVPDAVETKVPLIFYGSVSGANVFGIRITTHGTSNEGFNADSGQMKINYTGARANATCVLIATSTLEIDNIEFGDPNSRVKYGIVISDFEGGTGHQNKYNNIVVRALESGGIGISSKTNNANSGSHTSDTQSFTGKTTVFAESWAVDMSGNQTLLYDFENLSAYVYNNDNVANSGTVRYASTNNKFGIIANSAPGHYFLYLTNEYLDIFATSAPMIQVGMIYSETLNCRKHIYCSGLDLNGGAFEIGSDYMPNFSGGQMYGVLLDSAVSGTHRFIQFQGAGDVYNYSNSVGGQWQWGLLGPNTTPNWGSRTSTAYTTPLQTLNTGALGLRNAGGSLSTVATNAAGDVVLTPIAALRSSSLLASSPSIGVGYATGAGGTITQLTDKSTGVTLDKVTGTITTSNAALGAGAEVSFVVTNSTVAATDVPVVAIKSGGSLGAYAVVVSAVGAGSFTITLTNLTAGSLSEAIVLSFVVIKGVAA